MLHNLTALNSCGVVSNVSLFFKVNHQRDCSKQNKWVMGTLEVHLTLLGYNLGSEIPVWTELSTVLRPGLSDESQSPGEFHLSSVRWLRLESHISGLQSYKIHAVFRWNTWIIELEYRGQSSLLTVKGSIRSAGRHSWPGFKPLPALCQNHISINILVKISQSTRCLIHALLSKRIIKVRFNWTAAPICEIQIDYLECLCNFKQKSEDDNWFVQSCFAVAPLRV